MFNDQYQYKDGILKIRTHATDITASLEYEEWKNILLSMDWSMIKRLIMGMN